MRYIRQLLVIGALAVPVAGAAQDKKIAVGTSADRVVELRGRAARAPVVVGRDEHGLLVEWHYPDAVYLMGRRTRGGVEAYRVLKISTPRRK